MYQVRKVEGVLFIVLAWGSTDYSLSGTTVLRRMDGISELNGKLSFEMYIS